MGDTPAQIWAMAHPEAETPQDRQARLERMDKASQDTMKVATSVVARPSGSQNIFDVSTVPDNIMFWLLIYGMYKNDPKGLSKLFDRIFRVADDALDAYCRAGAGNRITAWGSGILTSLYMERFGMLTHSQATGFHLGLNIATGIEIAEELAAAIMTIAPWKAITGKDLDFPTTLVLGDKSRKFQVSKGVK